MNADKTLSRLQLVGLSAALLNFPVILVAEQSSFPADGHSPVRSQDAAILEAACPGHVVWGKAAICNVPCPPGSGFAGDKAEWSFVTITRGHFLSADSDDAAIATAGCEPHASNFGGTILATHSAAGWKKVWYKPGIMTGECHTLALPTGRETLACIAGYSGQGAAESFLYLLDLDKPEQPGSEDWKFFSVADNTGTCGAWYPKGKPHPATRASLLSIAFGRPVHGLPASQVRALWGTRQMTAADDAVCLAGGLPPESLPKTREYRIEFVYDGKTYKPSAATAKVAAMVSGN